MAYKQKEDRIKTIFRLKYLTKEPYKSLTLVQQVEAERNFVKLEMRRDEKHYKAFNNRQKTYRFKGKVYVVEDGLELDIDKLKED